MTNKKDTGEQKRKVSVALEYVPGEEAPKIIASGKGVLAEKIIERAKEADVILFIRFPETRRFMVWSVEL